MILQKPTLRTLPTPNRLILFLHCPVLHLKVPFHGIADHTAACPCDKGATLFAQRAAAWLAGIPQNEHLAIEFGDSKIQRQGSSRSPRDRPRFRGHCAVALARILATISAGVYSAAKIYAARRQVTKLSTIYTEVTFEK